MDMDLQGAGFRDKVLGCWMGKNIGGTLGMPFEWKRQVNHVSFYTQELGGEPLPNDDLDIQLLWLMALEWEGLDLTPQLMAEYWTQYVVPHWSEYGTAKANMRSGLLPPMCGALRNEFKDSCGSFIRSEIWACIAPGNPGLAARYAYYDGMLDHGNGEGTWAALFTASLESAAFVVKDLRQLIEIGLSYIPADCGTAKAVRDAVRFFDEKMGWQQARDRILELHRGKTFFGHRGCIADEDFAKGFYDGKLGYDAPSNIAFLVMGLLYGGDDFGQTLCISVNCGEDTDCTAATAGSIWGILHGFSAIPQKWIDPIGHGIKTITLNLGDCQGIVPKTVDELTDRTIQQAVCMKASMPRRRDPLFRPHKDASAENWKAFCCTEPEKIACGFPNGPVFTQGNCQIAVDYGKDGALIRSGQPKTIRLIFRNLANMQANLNLHVYLPEESGWSMTPGTNLTVQSLPSWIGRSAAVEITVTAEKMTRPLSRAALEITADGRPFTMLVPLQFLNGDGYVEPTQA